MRAATMFSLALVGMSAAAFAQVTPQERPDSTAPTTIPDDPSVNQADSADSADSAADSTTAVDNATDDSTIADNVMDAPDSDRTRTAEPR